MSIGRRKVRLEDASAWIFNRMVSAYEARPAYPGALLTAISELSKGGRVLDVGAGIGHVALPLAATGHEVTALEPAVLMLERLRARANERALGVRTVNAMAEQMPLPDSHFDLVVVSDVVHFLDSERAAREVARVLAAKGSLAIVTSDFANTPFMRAAREIMEKSAPRRPREISNAITELLAVARVRRNAPRRFSDETRVEAFTLERILGSVSFLGPAMNPERTAAFRKRIRDIEHEPLWARNFTLWSGQR